MIEKESTEIITAVDFNMTLEKADAERRLGRVVFQWDDIKGHPLCLVSSIFTNFFPLDIHLMGKDSGAYVFVGLSPLFKSLLDKGKELDFGDIPFYMLSMNPKTGEVSAIEMEIEKKLIKKPTAKEVKEHG